MSKLEQLHVAKRIHILDVQEGDLIDTEGLWPATSLEALAAECELGEVDVVVTQTGASHSVIHFINFADTLLWDLAEPIVVQRRYNS